MIKVMVIDDEPEICRLISKMVERQPDYQVVAECGDFAGAVVEFTRYKPDVVFADIDLNGESGLECAKVLTELNPKVKIIFATAHSEYMANAFEPCLRVHKLGKQPVICRNTAGRCFACAASGGGFAAGQRNPAGAV